LPQTHRILNSRLIEKYQKAGVTFLNPETVEMGPEVVIGKNTVIEGNEKPSLAKGVI